MEYPSLISDEWCISRNEFDTGSYGTPFSTNDSCDDDEDGDFWNIDCDDNDPNRNSSATEIWYDGVDQDCSGGSDYDQDSDGEDSDQYGGADCDDTNEFVNTSASDANIDGVDNDCNGLVDDGAQAGDQDGDGIDVFSGDCDDNDPAVYPERSKFGTTVPIKIVLVIVILIKMVMVKIQTNMVVLTVMIPMLTSIPKV